MKLEMNQCTISAGYKQVLKDINFKLKPASFTVIKGKNGSGKTVFLNALLGLNKNVKGNQIIDYSKDKICYITDIPFFTDDETVVHVLKTTAYFYSVSIESLHEILETLHFDPTVRTDDKIHHLSAGTRKKLQLLPLFINDLELYVLDEIMLALDVSSQAVIFEQLITLHVQGATLLLTEHSESILNQLSEKTRIEVYLCADHMLKEL